MLQVLGKERIRGGKTMLEKERVESVGIVGMYDMFKN